MTNVEVKEDVVKISGYASTKDIDRGGDMVLPTAFTDSIAESQRTSGVAMLLGHDHAKVIGGWDKIEVDSKGIPVEGSVRHDIDDCMAKIKAGDLRGMSIGYRVQEYQIEDGQGHVMYRSATGLEAGYDWDDLYDDNAIRVITKLDLVEISVVATPMNPYSFISSVKAFFAEEIKEFKQFSGKVEAKEEPVEVKPEEPVEDAPEPVKIEEETPAPVVPEETPAPAEGEKNDTNGTGEEVPAVETTAPVETLDSPEPVESEPVKAGEEDEKAIAFLEKVKPLIAEMVKGAVAEATETLMKQNTELNNALASLKQVTEAHKTALENIEAPLPSRTVRSGGDMARKMVITDSIVLKTIGQ